MRAKLAKAKTNAEIVFKNCLGSHQNVVERFYSSSIWLYITRTAEGARDGAFRIGVLHLVALRAASERLYGCSERARKRGADSGFRSGLDAALSRVLTSIDLNEPHCEPIPPDLRLVRIRGGPNVRRDEYRAGGGCLRS